MSWISDKTRREFKAGDDIRDAGLTTPEDVVRHDDIRYGDESHWQALDIYRPRGAEGPLPVIVSVHGGAWVYGDKERYQYYCLSLAQRGFAVINFSYRLAPEYKYPAPLEDTNAVFHWLMEHGGEYGLDAGRVFAVGDSAGAHLLALYACICTNPEYAARYPFAPPKGLRLLAVALNCGVYDIRSRLDSDLGLLMADLMPGGCTEEEIELVTPLNHMTSDFPPSFLMTANADYLRDQTPILAARLMALEVPFLFRCYGDRSTPLEHVFHVNMRCPESGACNDDECDFFRRFL